MSFLSVAFYAREEGSGASETTEKFGDNAAAGSDGGTRGKAKVASRAVNFWDKRGKLPGFDKN